MNGSVEPLPAAARRLKPEFDIVAVKKQVARMPIELVFCFVAYLATVFSINFFRGIFVPEMDSNCSRRRKT